jgi:hypothetical protein
MFAVCNEMLLMLYTHKTPTVSWRQSYENRYEPTSYTLKLFLNRVIQNSSIVLSELVGGDYLEKKM